MHYIDSVSKNSTDDQPYYRYGQHGVSTVLASYPLYTFYIVTDNNIQKLQDYSKLQLKAHILPHAVTSGVPQGSVLRPTLFLIYINDLVTHIQSTVPLFADDCLIYCPISTPADHQILQEYLQKLSAWADKWEMKFNINKCCIMQLSKHHHKNEFLYSMSGKVLKIVEQHSYLGVITDHTVKLKSYMYSIRQK